jgi:hypothetical protein
MTVSAELRKSLEHLELFTGLVQVRRNGRRLNLSGCLTAISKRGDRLQSSLVSCPSVTFYAVTLCWRPRGRG